MIRDIDVKKNGNGDIEHLRIVFGPHHYLELETAGGKTTFHLGTTHHGFHADASEVNSELEAFINEIRSAHPENRDD